LPLQVGAAASVHTEIQPGGKVIAILRSEALLQSVAISCDGFTPDDNYFHVAPGFTKRIVFTPRGEALPFRASLEALNLREAIVASLPLQEPIARTPGRPANSSVA
jgi:hypothetical protein